MKKFISLVLLVFSAGAFANPVADLEGKHGYDRRAAITRMSDTDWGGQRFSIEKGIELLQGLTGTDRYYAAKSLLGSNRYKRNMLPGNLSVRQMNAVLDGVGEQRGDLIAHLADFEIPAGNFGVAEIQSLIGDVAGDDYERSMKALMGSNQMHRNYAISSLGVDQVDALLSRDTNRAGMIRYMADYAILEGNFTVDGAEKMMRTQSGMDRHDSVKALLGSNQQKRNYLNIPLSFVDAQRLLDGTALRSELINYFSDRGVFADRLTANEAARLLENIKHTDRFETLKTLLGFNQQQRDYLRSPLSVNDVYTLLAGTAYRDEMIGLMADRGVIVDGISVADAVMMMEQITRADRYDAVSSLLGNNKQKRSYITLPITAAGAIQLMEGGAYRDELIGFMVDHGLIENRLSADDTVALLEDLVGMDRYDALLALMGENGQTRNYLDMPMGPSSMVSLFERTANRKELIALIADQGMVDGTINAAEAEHLLGRLYGEEREQVLKILQGDNRLKRIYLSN